ncbi:MAG: hypothetical protein HPY71_13680 [Firmicutes bacterium]|nr:hypothetical protein [Bacillota bacterium]
MIHGVSDRRRLPRAGKIRLGEKTLSQKTGALYPRAVDYFVWPDEYRNQLTKIFGERAKEIDIIFPVDDLEQIAPQYLKRYGTTGLSCRGDGITAERVSEGGEWVEVECNPEECPDYRKKCRRVMNLRFVIPQLISEGVFQIDTSSYHSIVNINSGLDYIRALVGRIAMVPLKLRIIPKEVQPDGKKKQIYVLDIKLASALSLDDLRRLASEEKSVLALPPLQDQAPPDDLFPEEAAQYQQPEEATEERPMESDENMEINDVEDDVESLIEQLFDELGFTQARRTLVRRRYPNQQLLLDYLLSMQPSSGEVR